MIQQLSQFLDVVISTLCSYLLTSHLNLKCKYNDFDQPTQATSKGLDSMPYKCLEPSDLKLLF